MVLLTWRGLVADPLAVREALLEWVSRFAETAAREGWIGSSGGITSTGEFIALGLMDSPEAARLLGDRPGQAEWWDSRLAPLFVGPVVFRNCSTVEVSGQVDKLTAQWIEVIEGHSVDIARMRALARQAVQPPHTDPDVVASILGFHDETPGRFTQATFRVPSPGESDPRADSAGTTGTDAIFDQLAALTRDAERHVLEKPWIDWSN